MSDYSFTCLAVHPTDPDIAYAGCEQNLIFKTTNGGSDWNPLTIPPLPVTSLAINSFWPDYVYAAIGSGSYSDGIYKTTNGGAFWDVAFWLIKPNALAIEKENPEVIYAGSREAGITHSLDGGSSWSYINNGLTNLDIQYITIDPSNRRTIYAATWGGGVFRYTWVPDVAIELEPDSTIIHPGGTLSFYATFCNNTNSYQTFWVQAMVLTQYGTSVPISGPIQMTLQSSVCRTFHVAYPVPMGAPSGTYRFRAWLGTPAQGVWDVESFQFTIVSKMFAE